jgi:hypothetical protein
MIQYKGYSFVGALFAICSSRGAYVRSMFWYTCIEARWFDGL